MVKGANAINFCNAHDRCGGDKACCGWSQQRRAIGGGSLTGHHQKAHGTGAYRYVQRDGTVELRCAFSHRIMAANQCHAQACDQDAPAGKSRSAQTVHCRRSARVSQCVLSVFHSVLNVSACADSFPRAAESTSAFLSTRTGSQPAARLACSINALWARGFPSHFNARLPESRS